MDRPQTYDRERVHMNLARLKTHGQEFEIVIDPDAAMKYRKGLADIKEALKSENIYHDAKKGELVSEHAMEEIFGTAKPLEIAEKILKEGEIQLTSDQRDKLREEKRKRLIDLIHRFAVDPKTGNPHPHSRIENAMKEAKIKIEEQKSAEDQVQNVLHALKPIIPIKLEIKDIEVKLSASYAAKLYGTVQKFGKILKEEWQNDGSWKGVVEVPAGIEPELYDKLNNETHGSVETKVVNTK